MKINDKNKKEFFLKQKIFLYLYKSKQYLNNKWFFIKKKNKKFYRFYLFLFHFF